MFLFVLLDFFTQNFTTPTDRPISINLQPGRYYIECVGPQDITNLNRKGDFSSGFINISNQNLTVYATIGGSLNRLQTIKSSNAKTHFHNITEIRYSETNSQSIIISASYVYQTTVTDKPSFIAQLNDSFKSGISSNSENIKAITFDNSTTLPNFNQGNGYILIKQVYQCPSHCLSCEDANSCAKCEPTFVMKNNECILNPCLNGDLFYQENCYEKCPLGTFQTGQTCNDCPPSCQKCDNSSTCQECTDGYILFNGICIREKQNRPILKKKSLLDDCEDGYYSVDDRCEPCFEYCSTCVGKPDSCTSCNKTGYYKYLHQFTCENACPPRTVSSSYVCVNCPEHCEQCLTPSYCKKCDDSYYLYASQCYSECPEGTYYYENTCVKTCPSGYYGPSNSNTCLPCSTNCRTCSLTSTNCTTCLPSSVYKNLNNYRCIRTCPNGYFSEYYYQASYNTYLYRCTQCPNNCSKCDSKTKCTACVSTHYLSNGKCVEACPTGSQADTTTRICYEPCPPDYEYYNGKCGKCTSSTFKYRYHGSCHSSCPAQTQSVNNICIDVPNCAQWNSSAMCTKCNTDYFLHIDGKCYESGKCPSGLYSINGMCQECFGYKNGSICYFCNNNQYRYETTGKCLASCPKNTYQEKYACYDHPENCIESSKPKYCSKCASGYNLRLGKCYKTCPTNTYAYLGECVTKCPSHYYKSNGTCKVCSSYCLECSGSTFQCTSCNKTGGRPYYNSITKTCGSTCTSRYYINYETSTCDSCPPFCLDCIDKTTCSKCQTYYYLYKGKCVEKCPESKFESTTECYDECPSGSFIYGRKCLESCPSNTYSINNYCYNCSSSCATCSDQLTCTSCPAKQHLYLGKCYDACPLGTYQMGNGNCEKCKSPCSRCIGTSSGCTKCVDNYYLYSGTCVMECPANTFPSEENKLCQPCNDQCATCNDLSRCTSCTSDKYLENGQCLASCPEGKYGIDGICIDCEETCLACDKLSDNCTKCHDGFSLYQNACISKCPDGYFSKANENVCQKCSSVCKTCKNEATNCTSCILNYNLNGSSCKLTCPTGTYADHTHCNPCESPCDTCENATYCTSCTGSYYLYNGECLTQCPNGTYKNDTSHKCVRCPDSCETCSSATSCSKCATGYSYYALKCYKNCPTGTYLNPVTNSCVLTCPSHYYPNSALRKCSSCSSNCLNCATYGSCLSCNTTSKYPYFYNNKCYASCPTNTYLSGSKCLNCSAFCTSCASASKCTTCNSGYRKYQDKCIPTCPITTKDSGKTCTDQCGSGREYNRTDSKCYFCNATTQRPYVYKAKCYAECPSKTIPIDNVCYDCPNNCLDCTSKISCTRCESGYVLYDGFCYSSTNCPQPIKSGTKCLGCPELTQKYVQATGVCATSCSSGTKEINNICYSCPTNCYTCLNTSYCSTCKTGYFRYNGKCSSSCPTGQYASGTSCTLCAKQCTACTNRSYCTSCAAGYYLYLGQCLMKCPSGTYPSDKTCMPCKSTCTECISETECTECKTNYFLNTATLTCSFGCATGKYKFDGKCLNCSESCSSCKYSADMCISCKGDLYLFNYSCIPECPPGTYPLNNKCTTCDPSCANCTNSSACSVCESGFHYYESRCYSSCPLGTFSEEGLCTKCSDSCMDCLDYNTCTKCKENTYFYESQCLTTCPDGFYGTGTTCQRCDQSCRTCNETSTHCLECQEGYTQTNNGRCFQTCPGGTYLSDGKCEPCNEQCQACSDANTCTSCKDNFFLYNSQCISNCPDNTLEYLSTCIPCTFPCTQCKIDPSNCTACYKGYLFENYRCIPIPTNLFTDSVDFTISTGFSYSDIFTKSVDFSKSNIFSSSDVFEETYLFSKSTQFSTSELISESEFFSKSLSFSMSGLTTVMPSDIDETSAISDISETNEHSEIPETEGVLPTTNSEMTDSTIIYPITNDDPNASGRESKSTSLGLIIGVMIGTVAVMAVIIIVVILLVLKKRNEKEPSNTVTEFNSETNNIYNNETAYDSMDNGLSSYDDVIADPFIRMIEENNE